MDALPSDMKHPMGDLFIQICKVTKLARGKKVALDVLYARLHSSLLVSQQLSVMRTLANP